VENDFEELQRSESPTGTTLLHTGERRFKMSGRLLIDSADATDREHDSIQDGVAPTVDASFQLGTAAGASDVINGVKYEINNVQVSSLTPDRSGKATVVEIDSYATATTAAGEFKKTYN